MRSVLSDDLAEATLLVSRFSGTATFVSVHEFLLLKKVLCFP